MVFICEAWCWHINIKTKLHQAKADFIQSQETVESWDIVKKWATAEFAFGGKTNNEVLQDNTRGELDLQWKPESNEDNWKDIQSRLSPQTKENQVKTVSKNKVLWK